MSDALKMRGNEMFRQNRFRDATALYTEAINADPQNFRLYCNRSASRLQSGPDTYPDALIDAMTAVSLNPYWPKSYLRLGNALRVMSRFSEAAEAYRKGLRSGDRENPLPIILREFKLMLTTTNSRHANRKTKVGGYIQFLINTCDIVRVSAEEGNCWRLASGRVAKKRTYGRSWLWYRFDKFPKPPTNRYHPGFCTKTQHGRRHTNYLAPQRYDDPEHDWHLSKSKNWGPWSCCGGESNSPPCTARLSKPGAAAPYKHRYMQTYHKNSAQESKVIKAESAALLAAKWSLGHTIAVANIPAAVAAPKGQKSEQRDTPEEFQCPLTLEVCMCMIQLLS